MSFHNFPFEGGYDLRRMCVSWFVSYTYYKHIDSEHKNWQTLKTYKNRISKYNASRQYHKLWLEKVEDMHSAALNRNTIGLTAEQVKKMANEVLQNWGEK